MNTRQTGPHRCLTTDSGIRCGRCHKLLAEVASRPWRITCVRCGHTNTGALRDPPPAEVIDAPPPPAAKTAAPQRRRRRSRALST